MKTKVSFLCVGALISGIVQNSFAMDLADDVYGRVNVSLGYNLQNYTGDDFKFWQDSVKNYGGKTNKYNHAVMLGVGYNFYLKVNDRFNPFVGFEAIGKLPLSGSKVASESHDEYGELLSNTMKFNEYFIFNGKFGGKINIFKDIAIAPYAMIGFNVSQLKLSNESGEYFKKSKVGVSTGAGVETLFKVMDQEFSAGVEYRFTMNKFVVQEPARQRLYTHNLMVKFGYHFL